MAGRIQHWRLTLKPLRAPVGGIARLRLPAVESAAAKMSFKIVGQISHVALIAGGNKIRELRRLRKVYGKGRWRKHKGVAKVELADGTIGIAEIHWYEAHGIGRKEFKIKRILEEAGG
jgi:hypothetical protein